MNTPSVANNKRERREKSEKRTVLFTEVLLTPNACRPPTLSSPHVLSFLLLLLLHSPTTTHLCV